MLYEIISKDETTISQMHIYLKNKTDNGGGNIPEILHDLNEERDNYILSRSH